MEAGGAGLCGVRSFEGGALASPCLGKFSSCAVDPIEKKPLRHWRPGTWIYSLGSVGCNAFCPFCQNHRIAHPDAPIPLTPIAPEDLRDSVLRAGLKAVAYTYNEPTLQAEYILTASPILREAGIATAMVTNGLFSETAHGVRDELARAVDAMNVDVKTFDANAYARLGGSLDIVRSNVAFMLSRGVHVEITNLIVPGVSDDFDDFTAMVDWIAGLSRDIPLHISRYFPAWRYAAPPTDVGLMENFYNHAASKLAYVYLGNV